MKFGDVGLNGQKRSVGFEPLTLAKAKAHPDFFI